MELLTSALVIVLLTTASTKPIGRSRRHDADIPDRDVLSEWLEANRWWSSESWESADSSDSLESYHSSESRSSESQSSESQSSESQSSESQSSEESSEEVFAVTTLNTPTAAMTTISRGDTTEPDVMSTEGPTMENLTPTPAATPATPVAVTTPGAVTDCVTHDIPTPTPITDNRGDN